MFAIFFPLEEGFASEVGLRHHPSDIIFEKSTLELVSASGLSADFLCGKLNDSMSGMFEFVFAFNPCLLFLSLLGETCNYKNKKIRNFFFFINGCANANLKARIFAILFVYRDRINLICLIFN